MSRCYPYPPPGFVRGEISLAESIKLQKVKEQQQESKKEKRRDQKDKKQKKKRSHEQTKDERQIEKKRRLHDKEAKSENTKVQSDEHGEKVPPVVEEQLEKSGLTEEFGAAHLPYQCGSPDSSASEDSSKRRRVGDCQKTHVAQASGLRIRFALGRQEADVPPEAPVNIKLPRAIRPAPEVVARPATFRCPLVIPAPVAPAPVFREPEVVCIPSLPSKQQEVAVIPESPERPSFSGRPEPATTQGGRSPAIEGYRGSKKSQRKEAKYKDLFQNWTPSPLSEIGCLGDDDEDWLFKSSSRQPRPQHQQEHASTCLDQSSQPLPDSSICSWPPRACHLEDVEVYALPYVVPF